MDVSGRASETTASHAPRPGAIATVYPIPLASIRSLDVTADSTFVELTQLIRRHFSAPHLK
jgi:hypothetical protein